MILIKSAQETLLSALQQVAGIVEKRHTMPVLANVLIRKTSSKLEFTASDLEIQLHSTFEFEGESSPASTTINARKLIDILKTIPASQGITVSLNQNKALLQSGKSRFSLQTLPSEDFPLVQEAPDLSPALSLPQKTLKALISQVHYSMAVQDIRYYLNGVLFVTEENALTLVATDGHRLAYARADVEKSLPKREVIIPRKTILELHRLLKDDDQQIEMQFASTQAKFKIGQLEFITKLIDGRFPDYNRVIPRNNDIKIKLPRQNLLNSLQRVSILTNDKFKAVRVMIEAGTFAISSNNVEHEEAWEELEVDYSGEKIDTGFNISYLIDVLTNNSAEFVQFELQGSSGSVLITVPERPEFKYVVMPMKM
jgi:DNA polymerase III subunit beta